MIQCGNCSGAHPSVAEVRACHARGPQAGASTPEQEGLFDPGPAADEGGGTDIGGSEPAWTARPTGAPTARSGRRPPNPGRSPARAGSEPARAACPPPSSPARPLTRPLPRPLDAWAGPRELARWCVITPGQAVPEAWRDVERVPVTAADLRGVGGSSDALADLLASRSAARHRLVIELDPAAEEPVPYEPSDPWELAATFTFAAERLWHLVWANSVDARDPAMPRWHWAEVAVAIGAGARAAPATDPPVGDILGPDGQPMWCDGGPVAEPPLGLTAPLVHRTALERGSLTPLRRAECTADLAPDQLAAVVHPGGPARIIAPAGSGKTRVLTERARHLLRGWGVPPSALTLVAFNVRAADEMRERTSDLPGLQVRTLNSLALSIVNGRRRVTTIDEREVRRILDSLVTFPRKANTDPASAWIDALAMARLALVPPHEVESRFDGEVPGFADVFPRYRAILAERGQVDFDEQIVAAIILLLTDAGARQQAQLAARLLLVDEFQDLAPAHLLLLRLLASPDLALFAVGDDDQTIYGHTGATPEWLIDFTRLFPGAGEHPLEVNYRCPASVVQAADLLLSHNRRRVPKVIRPSPTRTDPDDGALVIVTDDDATAATTRAVTDAIAGGAAPNDIAVLTRVNASLAAAQVSLRHHQVPVRSAVGPSYLERTGVRVALAWLRLALAPDKLRAADITAAVRRPSRGLSPRLVDWMAGCTNRAALSRLAARLNDERDSDKVSAFVADVELLAAKATRGGTTADLLALLRTRIGLDDALAKLDRSRGDAQSTHTDDVDALWALARLHPEPSTFATWLHDELSAPADPDGVTLATIHRVKGREWPCVVLHDVRDGLIPHRLADDRSEERRVFHVGLTRCSQRVTIVADPERTSPFLDELSTRATARPMVVSSPTPAGGRAGRAGGPTRAETSAALKEGPLHQALKTWRLERARADGVPAYVVFTNVTLDALAERAPTTLDGLRVIPGIGPAKRERYGQAVVDLIASVTATADP